MSVTGAINKFRLMPVPGPHRMRAVTPIRSERVKPSTSESLDRIILEVSDEWLVETIETQYKNGRVRWLSVEFDANEKSIKEKLQAAFSVVQSHGKDSAHLEVSIEPEGAASPKRGWSYVPHPECFLTGEQLIYVLDKERLDSSEEIYTSAGLARAIAVIYRQMTKPPGPGWQALVF